jgi:diguanylate cyclase (GGDEF)-like protein
MLFQNIQFDICYIDINHFKPYNDHYGFEKGDMVIKTLASVIQESTASCRLDGINFIGHIGGDDFIVSTHPKSSIELSKKIISCFEKRLPDLHGMEDYRKGNYLSKNRKGKEEMFDLLSISIGIVGTEVNKIDSYAQLASLSTEMKKAAKMQSGFSIVKDRRVIGGQMEKL